MPTLDFKGKQFVYSHHLSVPFRELVVDAKKSLPAKGMKPLLDDNLVIQGDNLEALKALLPMHAGKVDCIFIDAPYNTGNERWCYNDNVRSPLMKEWLKKSANPVDKEDLERHDKWLCMMWPRLNILHDLLAETGLIFLSIDDNEVHRLRLLLDEIFGAENFLASIIWQKKYSSKGDSKFFSDSHDYVLVYAKRIQSVTVYGVSRTEDQKSGYKNPDNDGRGVWTSGDITRSEFRENSVFEVRNPANGKVHVPPRGTSWRFPEEKIQELIADGRIWFGEDGTGFPRLKRFLGEVSEEIVPNTLWTYDQVGSSDSAKKLLAKIFGDSNDLFATPKPVPLIERIIEVACVDDAVILDSFAGSGTTAHAVLAANKKDNGNRRFILVECEDYVDALTAERVRRVIQGYKFQGTQREELYTEKITWTNFSKKASEILEKVESVAQLEGAAYDQVKKEIKDGVLKVVGERKVEEKAPGLGGSFTYCTLGEPINIESLLTGKEMPSYEALAKYVFYTATGQSLEKLPKVNATGFVGESELFRLHLIYKPDKAWLRSNEAALNAERMEAIEKENVRGKRAIVFAVAKFMSQKELTKRRIEFCQLPYAVHRILGD